jgi:hypothetical protein
MLIRYPSRGAVKERPLARMLAAAVTSCLCLCFFWGCGPWDPALATSRYQLEPVGRGPWVVKGIAILQTSRPNDMKTLGHIVIRMDLADGKRLTMYLPGTLAPPTIMSGDPAPNMPKPDAYVVNPVQDWRLVPLE